MECSWLCQADCDLKLRSVNQPYRTEHTEGSLIKHCAQRVAQGVVVVVWWTDCWSLKGRTLALFNERSGVSA